MTKNKLKSANGEGETKGTRGKPGNAARKTQKNRNCDSREVWRRLRMTGMGSQGGGGLQANSVRSSRVSKPEEENKYGDNHAGI